MIALTQAKEGQRCRIKSLNGNKRFISRITSVGLILDSVLEMIQNKGKYPLLIYTRDSMLAVNQKEAENIIVEVCGE